MTTNDRNHLPLYGYVSHDDLYNSSEKHYPPAPSVIGTFSILIGLVLASNFGLTSETPSTLAQKTAMTVGISLVISTGFDSRRGMRNLFRTDLMCLISLYFLTIAEFLFPQEQFDGILTVEQTIQALQIVLIGFAGLSIGRHFIRARPVQARQLNIKDISNQGLFKIFIFAALIGYLHMLLSVDFDVIKMTEDMMGPRFSQPWGRSRLGNLSSLLTELGLLRLILPPLTGMVWNRRHTMPRLQVSIVLLVFFYTVFQGFCGGARNIFVAYMSTFLLAYLLTLPRHTVRNTVFPIIISVFIVMFGSYHMLEFRNMGLRSYISNQVYASGTTRDTFAVDYNLGPIGLIASVFPAQHPYLGTEVIVWSIIKPIPRAFWPGKPDGLSVSIEETVEAGKGYTVASTFLGESYMMGGIPGVILSSSAFGALSAWWNQRALQRQSDYSMVIYALGFFVAVITMRSMFWLTTTMLPILALVAFRKTNMIR